MSGKNQPPRKIDSRVKHTRNALGDALLALMQEKAFETITVQEILTRAGVGRSTFYSHYTDKDDLFLSDMEDFLELMSTLLERAHDSSHRVLPVRELFQHVSEMRHMHNLLVTSGKMRDFLELGQGYFARAIERRIGDLLAIRQVAASRTTAIAESYAGAFFSLLLWWMSQAQPPSPAEMD